MVAGSSSPFLHPSSSRLAAVGEPTLPVAQLLPLRHALVSLTLTNLSGAYYSHQIYISCSTEPQSTGSRPISLHTGHHQSGNKSDIIHRSSRGATILDASPTSWGSTLYNQINGLDLGPPRIAIPPLQVTSSRTTASGDFIAHHRFRCPHRHHHRFR